MASGLNPEIFQFDNERNCMVLRHGDNEIPCVNWHQHSVRAVIENAGEEDQGVRVIKGNLEGSFVACLQIRNDGVEQLVIGHAIVHPLDRNKATKAHGRIVAARRLAHCLYVDTIGSLYQFAALHKTGEDGEEKLVTQFFITDPDALRRMRLNPQFLPSIMNRLRKLNG